MEMEMEMEMDQMVLWMVDDQTVDPFSSPV
jgi:hypothetical protein